MKKSLLILTSILFLSSNLCAGLIVRPARTQISLEKANTFNGKYTIVNDNEATISVAITTEDWNNSPNNKDVHVNDWLKVDKKNIILKPMEEADIEYTVTSADYEGSLSAMVSFTYRSPKATGINLMTSVPVYLTIKGTEIVEYNIEQINFIGSQRGSNPYIKYSVKNDGNVPVRFIGKYKIMKGKKLVFENRIREQSPVYAGTVRGFMEEMPVIEKGKYTLTISLDAYNKSIEKSCQFKANKNGDISLLK